ncbi:MAG: hypothetical protein NTV54_08135 [Ignavibacteriales bacterium]|nr:hypothetical protein [Ignavibacteriales bacterium]
MRTLFLFCVILFTAAVFAQTTTNPDISVIPRFRVESNDGEKLPAKREFTRPMFSLEETEIAFQAYLNPFAKADVILTKEGTGSEPIGIEEAYATFLRGLPLDLNVRLGKFRSEFGKINTTHPHAWPFLSAPLSVERFIGDAVNDIGISVTYAIPTGDEVYTHLTLGLTNGESIGSIDPKSGKRAGGIGIVDTTGGSPRYAESLRLMTFIPAGENSDLEIGVSGLTGIHDPYQDLRFTYLNLDAKYKWKPDMYTWLTVQGEFLLNTRSQAGAGNLNSLGAYLYADYQFMKIFSLGGRCDWTESPYSASEKAYGGAIFFGYYPVEETTAFRIQFQHVTEAVPLQNNKDVNTITLQCLFSLGPHKAHAF